MVFMFFYAFAIVCVCFTYIQLLFTGSKTSLSCVVVQQHLMLN